MRYEIVLAAYLEVLIGLSVFIFRVALRDPKNVITGVRIAYLMAIPIVGLFGRTPVVFDLFIAGIPVLAGSSAKKLAGIYVLFVSQFPALTTPLGFGSHYLFNFSAIYAFNLGSLFALCIVRCPRREHSVAIDACAILLFSIYCVATARDLPLNDVARILFQNFVNMLPPYLVLSRTLSSGEDASNVAMCFVLGALCNAVIGIFEALRHWSMYEQFYPSLRVPLPDLSSWTFMRGGLLQARGAVQNSAVLSLLTGMAVIPCLAFRERFRKPWRAIVIVLLLMAMLASASRGGWIATAGAIALYLLYKSRYATVSALAIAFALAYGLMDALPRSGNVAEILGRSGHAKETAEYRVNLLHRGIEEVRAHPIGGQSLAQLQVTMNDLRQGQNIIDFVNTHLFIALTAGLGGLAFWLLAWIIPLRAAWSNRERGAQAKLHLQPGLSIASPAALVVACFIALTLTSTIDHMLPLTMLSFGCLASFLSIRRSSLRSKSIRRALRAPQDVPLTSPLVKGRP